MNSDLEELRGKIDSNDPFMTRGHQILVARTYQKKKTPLWVNNKEETRKILLRSFPNLILDINRRARAARWARLIQLYWVVGYTHGQIVSELNDGKDGLEPVTLYAVRSALRSIKRASEGRRANGSGNFTGNRGGKRKGAGRKRKNQKCL